MNFLGFMIRKYMISSDSGLYIVLVDVQKYIHVIIPRHSYQEWNIPQETHHEEWIILAVRTSASNGYVRFEGRLIAGLLDLTDVYSMTIHYTGYNGGPTSTLE